MKRKRIFSGILIWFLPLFCLAGVAGGIKTSEAPQAEKTEASAKGAIAESEKGVAEEREKEIQREAPEEEPKRREISIAFDFWGDQKEHKLTLAAPAEGEDAYVLCHYDENGKILQQIFCGNLTEPVTFSFDGLAFGAWADLEMFPADSDTGLLFLWQDGAFSTTPISIPRYEEYRRNAMLTVSEDEEICEKEIYLLNKDRGRVEKARSYKLQKQTAQLTIWDELEKQTIFSGTIRLDEDGNPANAEYINMLLWDGLPYLSASSAEAEIRTWVGEEPRQPEEGEAVEIDSYEDMRYWLFDNSGHTAKYESRQALLSEFGFADSEPLYQYYGRKYGDLQLELYVDEGREQACGIVYDIWINSDLEPVAEMYGFTICSFAEAEWEGDPFTFRSVHGTTGEEMEDVKNYEESLEYTDFGRPKRFVSRGRVEGWSDEDMMQDILRIEFTYREDDTLFHRDYYHSHQAFGTTLETLDSYYDEHERVIYEIGYITHGYLEYYYIYDDKDGKVAQQPTYLLELDYDMGYVPANLIRFK